MLDWVQNNTNRLISRHLCAWYGIFEPLALTQRRWREKHLHEDQEEFPLISVYTPTYNRGELLIDRAVRTVLNQDYNNFEYIIVGDNCTDNTAELLLDVADPRIRFVNLKTRKKRYPSHGKNVINNWLAGPVIAANVALGMTRGKWIARIDDHALWTPDHLSSLLGFAQRENYEFITASVSHQRYGQVRIGKGHHAVGPYFNISRRPKQSIGNPIIGSTQTFFYRAYLNFFRYNIHCWRKTRNRVNDIDFAIRMYRAGVRMGFLDKILAELIPRPGEKTLSFDAFVERQSLEVRDYIRGDIDKIRLLDDVQNPTKL